MREKLRKHNPALYRFLAKKNLWEPSLQSKGIRPQTNTKQGPFKWGYLSFWNHPEWAQIKEFLFNEIKEGKSFYPTSASSPGVPNMKRIFRPLIETPFDRVKIVIIGQDPYLTEGLADGFAFSTFPNVAKIPPALKVLFTEYTRDTGFSWPRSGDLSTWARNGVLLINTIWTVRAGEKVPNIKFKSHAKITGKQLWQEFTCHILRELSTRKDKVVFIFLGSVAKEWSYIVDSKKHLVITLPHPSPRNFANNRIKEHILGSKMFTKACEFLNISTKIWKLP